MFHKRVNVHLQKQLRRSDKAPLTRTRQFLTGKGESDFSKHVHVQKDLHHGDEYCLMCKTLTISARAGAPAS